MSNIYANQTVQKLAWVVAQELGIIPEIARTAYPATETFYFRIHVSDLQISIEPYGKNLAGEQLWKLECDDIEYDFFYKREGTELKYLFNRLWDDIAEGRNKK